MRLLIEKHNNRWIFEFTCSNKCTCCMQLSGTQVPTPSFIPSATTPDVPDLERKHSVSKSCIAKEKNQSLPHDCTKPSRTRSFCQQIGKALRTLSGRQRKSCHSKKEPQSQEIPPAELQALPAELEGDSSAWELSGNPICMAHTQRPNHRGAVYSTPPTASMSRSPDVSPIQPQRGNQRLPLMSYATSPTRVQTNYTPTSMSSSTSPTVSPLSPTRLDPHFWNGMYVPQQPSQQPKGLFSPPHAFAPQAFSPPHEFGQFAEHTYGMNTTQQTSPPSTRRSSGAQSYGDPGDALPTPPVGSPMNTAMAYGPYPGYKDNGTIMYPAHFYQFNESFPPATSPMPRGAFRGFSPIFDNVGQPSFQPDSQGTSSQMGRADMFMTTDQDGNMFDNNDESPPAYSQFPQVPQHFTPGPPLLIPTTTEATNEAQPTRPSRRPTRRDNQTQIACGICGVTFSGEYRTGNLRRHCKSFHAMPTAGDDGRMCSICGQMFKRADARRKHEWKKHRVEEARPDKRRREKKQTEKRIYMPGADTLDTDTANINPNVQQYTFESTEYPQSTQTNTFTFDV